jgi:uncharacterized protein (UPF0333 family)
MKIVHIFPDSVYVNHFLKFIENNKLFANNLFFVDIQKNDKPEFYNHNQSKDNVYLIRNDLNSLFKFYRLVNKADLIIQHGLFNNRHNFIYLINAKKNITKIVWIVWGSDLYSYQARPRGIKLVVVYIIQKILKMNIRSVITWTDEDYNLFTNNYGHKSNRFKLNFYKIPLYSRTEFNSMYEDENQNKILKIVCGHSASETNNHDVILNKLKPILQNKDFKLILPLTYGDNLVKERIINLANNLFGESLEVLSSYMPNNEYVRTLSTSDVAVYYHQRQEALANTYQLLYLGKKIYLHPESPVYSHLTKLGFIIFDAQINLNSIFERFPEEHSKHNIELVNSYLSDDILNSQWKRILLGYINE